MEDSGKFRRFLIWLYTIAGSLYGIWMLYAGSLTNLLISALLYAPGTFLYIKARRELGEKIFPATVDRVAFVILILMALISLALFISGDISL